ncbi:DUF2321 domain-containing protein [Geomonas paludis]|uniref:DUF2321 domain-containing protein n=1 Tax=Geomonas paludis TaxID=2740185 RepID=A0ABY4LHL6_9BACT|nr:DUF2321 domain-containing protein [Geomonas paludis]UPU37491.1 DUF2321 domain-containing protein [Geomonas paludis]
MEGYDVAQVCPNGHVSNEMSVAYPDFNRDFCESCGEKTITTCPSCKKPIRGGLHGVFTTAEFTPPAFCRNCGQPFPWTQRGIQAAIDLATIVGGLQGEDAAQFGTSIQEVARDTAQAQVAAHRVKGLLGKVATTTASAIRDVMVDIVSETAKKIIWPS